MDYIKDYIEKNKDRFIKELLELLKIPSISADPSFKESVLNCSLAVEKSLKDAGADNVEVCTTSGYPIVYADKIIDKNGVRQPKDISCEWPLVPIVRLD